jgi:PAS domain S-box-containing protein
MPEEAEKMANVLLDALSEYVLFVDPQMHIRWANRAATESAGLDLEAISGRRCYEIWHERTAICPDCPIAKVLESGLPHEGEITSTEKKHWSIRGYPIHDEQGQLLGAAEIAVDITALRQAQQALEESESKYSTLVEQARDIVVIAQDGAYAFANQAIEISGYSVEEIIGMPITDLVIPETREEMMSGIQERFDGKNVSLPYEATMLRKDGSTLCLEATAAPIQYRGRPAVLGIARDITYRKLAEEAMRESEAKYSALVENAQDAIVILQDGICKYVNKAAEVIYGYTLEELQQRPFIELVAPESREKVVKRYQSYFAGDEEVARLHHAVVIHKDGTRREVESTGAVIEYQGNPAILGIFRDVTNRQQVEKALRESEERYRSVIQTCPDAITLSDLEGKLITANEQAARVHGCDSVEEMLSLGKTAFDFIAPEDLPRAIENAQKTLQEGSVHDIEYTLLRKDGSRFPAELSASVIPDAEGQPKAFVGVVRDITERKQVEEALRNSEQFSSSLLDSTPNAIIVINPDTSIQYVNRALETLTGYSAGEIVGRKAPFPWWTKETLEKTTQDLKDGMSGKARHLEEFFVKKTGEKFWVEIFSVRVERDGEFKYYVSNWVDITERRRSEQALRDSEERYRTLVQTSPDAIVLTDMNNKLVMVNQQTAQLLGFDSADEVLEKVENVFAYIDPEFQEIAHRRFEGYEQTRGSRASIYRLVRRDNSKVYAEVNSSVLTDVDEKLVGVISVIRDITDRVRAEEERRRLEEQIQHAQKLESLGILAGGIAHDFNNLLMGVLGNASLALLDLPEGSPVRHSVEQIEKTARAAADLTNQMLAYSGKGRFVVEPVELSKLVKDMAGLLKVSISKKVDLKFDFDRDLPPVDADAAQLRQVIMNLIINASEAIGDEIGVVSVRTGTIQADSSFFAETYTHDNLPEGTYVYLEVSDSGCGMDPETLDRIFDPFFTSKFTGRGLGLAAVLGIVRGHQGAVRVQSEPGQGTTIRVVFPPSKAEKHPPAPEPESRKPVKASGKILVVDDEATIRDVSRRMLESSGFEVITAKNGREAVEIFKQQGEEIAGVLLDATMPQMDGLETFKELRHIQEDIRVVLSSGYSEQEATQRFTGKGLTGFIQKPYRFNDLIDKMHEVLGN